MANAEHHCFKSAPIGTGLTRGRLALNSVLGLLHDSRMTAWRSLATVLVRARSQQCHDRGARYDHQPARDDQGDDLIMPAFCAGDGLGNPCGATDACGTGRKRRHRPSTAGYAMPVALWLSERDASRTPEYAKLRIIDQSAYPARKARLATAARVSLLLGAAREAIRAEKFASRAGISMLCALARRRNRMAPTMTGATSRQMPGVAAEVIGRFYPKRLDPDRPPNEMGWVLQSDTGEESRFATSEWADYPSHSS